MLKKILKSWEVLAFFFFLDESKKIIFSLTLFSVAKNERTNKQKYFEKRGTHLLFGNKPESCYRIGVEAWR